MTTPATLLSFVYHSTIPNYRDEIHYDIETAFRRFGLVEQAFGSLATEVGVPLPKAADVQSAAKAVEVAAFELRKSELAKRKDFADATATLLVEQMARLLAAEVAAGVRVSDVAAPAGANLVSYLYGLVYSPTYRRVAPIPDGFAPADWNAVKAALDAGGGEFAAILPAVSRLCGAVSAQFIDSLWPVVW